jgi:outer membrane receptor protein involved in Fe transport
MTRNSAKAGLSGRLRGQMLICLLATATAFSQTANNGMILGSVTDTTGAVIPDVTVTLSNELSGGQRSVVTDQQGVYHLLAIPAGTYDIKFEKPGFNIFESQHISLSAGDSLQLNAALAVSSLQQTVSVQGGVLNRVDTTSANLQNTISSVQLSNTPLSTRSWTQMMGLEPGVSSNEPQEPGFGSNTAVSYSFSGSQQSSNNYLVDGGRDLDPYNGNNVGMISMDAIAEMSIVRNDYTTVYGRDAGGIVNIITKSGTNKVHGSLFEYFRNDVLNARNYFASFRPATRYNDFGATLGGPLKRDKLFLFGSYEGRRIEQSTSTRTALVPTSAQIAGNFSGLPPITNPLTGLPFPNNQIPANLIDHNAQLLFQNYYAAPTPGFQQGALNFTASNPDGTIFNEELGRLDYAISPHLTLAGHYVYDGTTLDSPFGLFTTNTMPVTTATVEKENIYSANGTLTWTPSSSFLNVFTEAFFRNSAAIANTTLASRFRVPGFSVQRIFSTVTDSSTFIPSITMAGGYAGIQILWPQNIHSSSNELRDDANWIRGHHIIKFGGEMDKENKTQTNSNANNNGTFSFTGGVTGNAVADMLLGDAQEYTESSAHIGDPLDWTDWSLYVQDQFAVTPRLTIDPGLRWEYFPPEHDPTGHLSYFNPALFNFATAATVSSNGRIVPGTQNFGNGVVVAGPGNPYGNSLTNKTRDTFEPRIGFAYALTKDSLTDVRGGYGFFYDRWSQVASTARSNYPFDQSVSVFNTDFTNPAEGTTAIFPIAMTNYASPWKIPTTQKWSLDVQRQLPAQVLLDVGYAGSHGTHLLYAKNINQISPTLSVAQGTVSANSLVPFRGLGTINTYETGGNTTYNGLQVSIVRQLTSGLSFQVAYTYSKTMDDAVTPMNALAPQMNEWALSTYDRKHVLVFNYVYSLPFFKNGPVWQRLALAGWQVSGITSFESGNPITVGISTDQAGIGTTTQRPNEIGKPQRLGRHQEFFNTAAFSLPAKGTFGDAGRSVVRGPGILDFDVSAGKTWDLPERAKLEFVAQSFNVFNHAQFNAVNSTFGASGFGQITGANDPRLIQLGLHLLF